MWQRLSFLPVPFFKQIAPIVILHRELYKGIESKGIISNLILTTNVFMDFSEQFLCVTIIVFGLDTYHWKQGWLGKQYQLIWNLR